jgi:hypothetical protein
MATAAVVGALGKNPLNSQPGRDGEWRRGRGRQTRVFLGSLGA